MKILSTALLVFVSLSSSFARQEWSQGVVVLNSGEVKVGLLQYHPKWSAVSYKDETDKELVQTFPPNKLSQFRFFDSEIEAWRKFYTYSATENGFQRPIIYELVFRGGFSLLRKEKSIEPIYNSRSSTSDVVEEKVIREQVLAFDFFFCHEDRILPLGDFKKYAHAKGFFDELDLIATTHHLSWRIDYDIVIMMNYLNCSSGTSCLEDFALTRMASSH